MWRQASPLGRASLSKNFTLPLHANFLALLEGLDQACLHYRRARTSPLSVFTLKIPALLGEI